MRVFTVAFGICAIGLLSGHTVSSQEGDGVIRIGPDRKISSVFNKGATYHELEAQAVRVTTVFNNATAISERTGSGDLATSVTDSSGLPIATLSLQDNMGGLSFLGSDTDAARPTLDWAGRQAYALTRNRVTDIDQSIVEVQTEWSNGLRSTSRWRQPKLEFEASAKPTTSFTTFLTEGDKSLGWIRWYADKRVLAWSVSGAGDGYLDDKRLSIIGGWPFAPDMAWANTQAFAFHQLAKQSALATAQPKPGVGARILDFLMPTLHAQDGCTGLHWLDGTVVRVCCDRHDQCYVTYGCNMHSWWWPFGASWVCQGCNVHAVSCFASGGNGPYYPYP